MPGSLLHLGATVFCPHGGQAQPTMPNQRVLVGGQPVVTLATTYTVAGCSLPPSAGGPCATGQWIVGATRVLVGGTPVVLSDGQAVSAPTGAPLNVLVTQARVRGA